jgi:predicted RNase H-like HicB family nuclease
MNHEKDSGWYVVTCPALPGCVSQGRTEQEAISNIKEAALAWFEVEDEMALRQAQLEGTLGKKLALAI